MRIHIVALLLIFSAGAAALSFETSAAQTPSSTAARPAAAKPATAAPQVHAVLAQVMRGILLPSSNVVFYAQDKNPAKVKPAPDPLLATDPLASSYGGWAAVENSALALTEAANLLTIPGRMCSNKKPVPVKDAEWLKFVQGLRDAGMTAYKAAQTKRTDKMLDAADAVTMACTNCHERYRDKETLADRCI